MPELPSPALSWALAFAAGAALGIAFFAGLWWTVRRGTASEHPARWFFGSLLLRAGLVVPAMVAVADGGIDRLLPCLAGFVVARALVVRRLRAPAAAGGRHAP